jgi:proteasome lid subunit RPN8/RPN11
MTPRISTDLRRRLVAAAAASPGAEICGLLLGRDGAVAEARACRNVAADPATRFEIDPAALFAAHRAARAGGPAILGCYHSHPSGRAVPSACDAAAAEPNGWLWLIVAGEEVRGWRAVIAGAIWGRFDEAV